MHQMIKEYIVGLLLITRFTLQEAIRRRLFLVIVVLTSLLLVLFIILFNAALQVNLASNPNVNRQLELLAGGIFLTLPTMWVVYLQCCIMTIFLTVGMISSEVEAGTFSVIVPKPLRRAEIVLGKWLGYALILSVYTALLFICYTGVIYWKTGYWSTQALSALGMLELAMLALLGFTTLGSALVPTMVNGAIVLILFVGAPIPGAVSSIVNLLTAAQGVVPQQSDTLQNTTTVVNLIMPPDVLWHGAAYYLLPTSALDFLPTQGYSAGILDIPFISPQPIPIALLIWVAFYCVILPVLAAWHFQCRDL